MARAADRGDGTWRNWAGNVTVTPARWYRPDSAAGIADAITEAARDGLTVRAIGSGHSFTQVVAAPGAAVDLAGWTGIVAADTRTGLVTVRSGTRLRELNAAYGRNALVKRNNRLAAGRTVAPLPPVRRFYEYEVMENAGFGLLCRAGRSAPRLIPRLNKVHTLDAGRLRELYPRFGDFIGVRDEADPAGRFTNPYLDRVLGPPPGQAVWAGLPADRPG